MIWGQSVTSRTRAQGSRQFLPEEGTFKDMFRSGKDWQKVDFVLKMKIWDTWTKKTDLLQGLEIHLKKAAGTTDLQNDSTKPMMDVSTHTGKEGEDMHPEGQAAGRSEGSMRKSQQQILVTCS